MFEYAGCYTSQDDRIKDTILDGKSVSWRTLSVYVPRSEVKKALPNYKWSQGDQGKHLKNDVSVVFYRSKYRQNRCYLISAGGLYYLFVLPHVAQIIKES